MDTIAADKYENLQAYAADLQGRLDMLAIENELLREELRHHRTQLRELMSGGAGALAGRVCR